MSKIRLKDKVGGEKFEEIAEKEWKVAELTEKDIKRIQKKSKNKMNPNSLKNLAQYNKRSKEGKEKSLENMRPHKKNSEIDRVEEVTGEESAKELIMKMIPLGEVLEIEEEVLYKNYLKSFMLDFKESDISQSDIDDILQLSMNKVLEYRLLKECKGKPSKLLNATQAIERIRKYNDKLKENLSARRRDRIVPKNLDDVSIVDIAAAFDEAKKREIEEREAKLLEGEKAFLESREFKGNREDEDVTMEIDDPYAKTGTDIPEL